jgi:acetoin utilization deacetylase AcuC-like enzyme
MIVIYSDRFEAHQTPPGHPESPARAQALGAVALWWRDQGHTVDEPRAATHDELARVHDASYLRAIAATAGRSMALDPDTFTSPESQEVALLAAGAALTAVEHALSAASDRRAVALVRPPGHHAERDRAMGFCLYNNVAAAAAHALERGCQRVAVVDYDVHHGNGTQWIFYDDPRVLYVSTHQYPYYPGTGAADEVGVHAGAGFTFNVPLEVGATDGDYDRVFRELVVPVVRAFAPDLVIVSAGFDAHERDPLAGMRMSTAGYANLTRQLCGVADECCGGRTVFVTEGGYDLPTLAACARDVVRIASALGGVTDASLPADSARGATRRSADAIAAVRAAHHVYWPIIS